MTRQTMLDALDQIEAVPKGHVYAARRGVVGAVKVKGGYIAFRRTADGLQAETWPQQCPSNHSVDSYSVPTDLRERVTRMLAGL